jgi:transposase
MGKLEDVSTAALRAAFEDAASPKAVKRLVVALAYKDGVSVATLSRRYGVPGSTVYAWLDRFETHPPAEAAADSSPPGRPSELTSEQRERLKRVLSGSPRDVGYDETAWSGELARRYIAETFGVDYSAGYVRNRFLD